MEFSFSSVTLRIPTLQYLRTSVVTFFFSSRLIHRLGIGRDNSWRPARYSIVSTTPQPEDARRGKQDRCSHNWRRIEKGAIGFYQCRSGDCDAIVDRMDGERRPATS